MRQDLYSGDIYLDNSIEGNYRHRPVIGDIFETAAKARKQESKKGRRDEGHFSIHDSYILPVF